MNNKAAVIEQYGQKIADEYQKQRKGEPVLEDERLENMRKCHNCGSIEFRWAGTCRLCAVCGSSEGCD